jgi:hypothetical protein
VADLDIANEAARLELRARFTYEETGSRTRLETSRAIIIAAKHGIYVQWHKMFYDDCRRVDSVWISQKEFYYSSASLSIAMHTGEKKCMRNEKSARRHYELSANILQLKGLSGFRSFHYSIVHNLYIIPILSIVFLLSPRAACLPRLTRLLALSGR